MHINKKPRNSEYTYATNYIASIYIYIYNFQGLLYHRTCKSDFLCSLPSLNSYLHKGNFLMQCQYHGYSIPSEISLYVIQEFSEGQLRRKSVLHVLRYRSP